MCSAIRVSAEFGPDSSAGARISLIFVGQDVLYQLIMSSEHRDLPRGNWCVHQTDSLDL